MLFLLLLLSNNAVPSQRRQKSLYLTSRRKLPRVIHEMA